MKKRRDVQPRGDFGGLIGQSLLQQGLLDTRVQRDELDTQDWEAQNRRILAELEKPVENLGFVSTFDVIHSELEKVPRFVRENMALRKLHWIPDDSEETRQAAGRRVRAVYGYAAILTNESSGIVDRNYHERPHKSERIRSAFYVLGLGVEEPGGQTSFLQLVGADQHSPYSYGHQTPELYDTCGGSRYRDVISSYVTGIERTKKGRGSLPYEINPDTGRENMARYLRRHPSAHKTVQPEQEIEARLERSLADIETYPEVSTRPECAQWVNRELLQEYSTCLAGLATIGSLVANQSIVVDRYMDYLGNDSTMAAMLTVK